MKRLALLIAALLLSGCVAQPTTTDKYGVAYWHDDTHAVSCWLFDNANTGVGISCLPDSEVNR